MSRSNILALVKQLHKAGQNERPLLRRHTEGDPMSQPNILALVKQLHKAGQNERPLSGHMAIEKAERHNAQVDAAAKALVAEIEKQPWEKFPLKNPQEILHIPEVP